VRDLLTRMGRDWANAQVRKLKAKWSKPKTVVVAAGGEDA